MTKKIFCACLVLLMALSAMACENDESYEDIEMSITLDTLCHWYGPLTPNEDGMVDLGEVLCAFYESGRLWAKSLVYENIADVAMLVDGDLAAARKLHQGDSMASVQTLLGGEGTEIARINLSDEENSGMQRVLAWKNAQGEVLEALFELDDGEWILFAVVAIAE